MVGIRIKKNLLQSFIDAFIIVMQVTYGMSMLKVWLLDPFGLPFIYDITFLTILCYCLRFKKKFRLILSGGFFLPKLLIVIYLLDFIQLLFKTFAGFALLRAFFLIDIYFFIEYMVSLYYECRSVKKDSISILTKPYEIYSVYNVITVCICAILLMTGVLSATDNPVPENSLLRGNMDTQTYYFPGHLSLVMSSFRLLGFLGVPVLTGLSHEPHVLWWIIGPSLYLLLDHYREKKGATLVFLIAFLFLSLLATSFIALAVFVATLMLEFFYSFFISKQKSGILLVFLIAVSFFAIILLKNEFLMDALSLMVDEKVNSGPEDGSMGYSVASLSYLFSPRALFGWGNVTNLGWGYELKGADIGIISFLLDMVLFISLYVRAFKLFFLKDAHKHYIGLACLYFLFHSLKLGTQVFTYPYFTFIVVLITIASMNMKPNQLFKGSTVAHTIN